MIILRTLRRLSMIVVTYMRRIRMKNEDEEGNEAKVNEEGTKLRLRVK